MARKNKHGLTEQQEGFVRAYLDPECTSAAAAYRVAYPKSRHWKDDAVYCNASQLLSKPKVQQRLDELRAQVETTKVMSLERCLEQLTFIANADLRGESGKVDLASLKVAGSVVIKAIERISKMQGYDAPEKHQVEAVEFNIDLGGRGKK